MTNCTFTYCIAINFSVVYVDSDDSSHKDAGFVVLIYNFIGGRGGGWGGAGGGAGGHGMKGWGV